MTNQKELYTIEETTAFLQCNRATVYNRMNALGIKAHKFKGMRKKVLTKNEVNRLHALGNNDPQEAGASEVTDKEECFA